MGRRTGKVLRLRVHRDGTIREHIILRGQRFTYGHSADNDLVVLSAHAPQRSSLVECKGGRYRILVPRGARGEVCAGESVLQIPDLIRHGFLRRKRDHYILPLSTRKSGKLELDGLLIEYDFVAPPEDLQALPDYSWRKAIWRAVVADPILKVVFLVLLAANLVAVDKVKKLEFPERQPLELERVPERFAKFIPRALRKEQPPPSAMAASGRGGGEQSREKQQEQEKPKQQRSQSPSSTNAQSVVQKGILGLIGGVGESASSSSVVDFLVDKGVVKELDEVLAETGDLQVGRSNGMGNQEGSLDDLFALADLSNVNVDEVAQQATSGIGDVELKKEGLVELNRVSDVSGSEDALGQRTEQQLNAVIAANRGRLEYIYNKYLRQDPRLSGVIRIEVTIEPDGTVSKVRVVEATVNNLSFVNEIVNAVRRWRFPPIPEGVVIATYPLVFYRAE